MAQEVCPSWVIRAARHDDVFALSMVWRELMDYHVTSDERFALAHDATERWRELTHDLIERHDGFVLAADHQGSLVGLCVGWIAKNPVIYRVTDVGFLSEIAVTHAWRRRGVGRALMQQARQWFSDHSLTEFQLSTAVWNEPAQAFWRSLHGTPLLVRYQFPLDPPAERPL